MEVHGTSAIVDPHMERIKKKNPLILQLNHFNIIISIERVVIWKAQANVHKQMQNSPQIYIAQVLTLLTIKESLYLTKHSTQQYGIWHTDGKHKTV